VILVLALAAGAGWWFLAQHRGARLNASPTMAGPGDVRPPAARPADIKVDPDAPAIDTPLRPVPPPDVVHPQPPPH